MSIMVKFFASLREKVGRGEAKLNADPGLNVARVWDAVCGDLPMPGNTLMAVNMEYADAETPVGDGDEVAFFPPVTGG